MEIERRLEAARALPALRPLSAAAVRASVPAYLVGGTVRDALLGLPVGDLDIAVEGDPEPLLGELGVTARRHARFGTASTSVAGHAVDLVRCRRERYPVPGGLPEVEPAPLGEDLARRDFSLNAMAVPLAGEITLLDPCAGAADLERGLLRVLHERSFVDDPTRAYRAARYAARLGLTLEAGTEELLRATEPGTLSRDRRRAEIERLAAEPAAVEAISLLAEWGVEPLPAGALGLAAEVERLVAREPWCELGLRQAALAALLARGEAPAVSVELAGLTPATPSEGVAAAAPLEREPELLLLARAAGAAWLDRWLGSWRRTRLSIGGADLIARGIRPGPAIGRALREVLRRRLDGELAGDRDAELEVALRIAAAEEA